MIKLTELAADYRQRHTVPIEGSATLLYLTLEFKTNLNCWFFSISWGEFVSNNEQVVTSPNMLRQYMNLIPFGITVTTTNFLDPVTLECWVDGTASMLILNSTEVQTVESTFHGD